MKEKDLNIKYICDETSLSENDELIPIILDMIKESYKSGLCQAEYDNTMGLIEENQELKKQLEEYKNSQSCSFVNICKNVKIANYNQQKEFIKYLEDEIKIYENDIQNFKNDYNVYFSLINDLRVSKAKIEEILQKYKSIIGVSDGNN